MNFIKKYSKKEKVDTDNQLQFELWKEMCGSERETRSLHCFPAVNTHVL